jgi:hypothetical protein
MLGFFGDFSRVVTFDSVIRLGRNFTGNCVSKSSLSFQSDLSYWTSF